MKSGDSEGTRGYYPPSERLQCNEVSHLQLRSTQTEPKRVKVPHTTWGYDLCWIQ